MDITLPANSWLHRNLGDTVIWALPGHTDIAPYLAMFKARPLNGDTGSYQTKVVRSFLNSVTGARKNLIIEGNVRNVAWQDPTDAAAAFAVFAAIMGDADYPNKALVTGQLPT
jgi:hypothetical protein